MYHKDKISCECNVDKRQVISVEEQMEEYIKQNYISKLKIKAKRIKLIDDLKSEKYKSRTSQKMLQFAINLLDEILEE